MKKLLKRTLAISAVLALLAASVIVTFPVTASAESSRIRNNLNRMLSVYPDGSYFSANGGACSHSATTICSNCTLQNIPARGGLPAGSIFSGGNYTCLAFVRYAFYVINGTTWGDTQKITQVSYNNVYRYASLGDYIYYQYNGVQHGGIYISGDETGYYMYEANYYTGTNKVSYCGRKHTEGPVNISHANNYDPDPDPTDSSITFSNVSNPPDLVKGSGFYMNGTITSTYPISTVQGYFINASTGAEISTPTKKTVSPNATTVDILSTVDPVLYFAELPVGTWKLVLTATDRYGYQKTHYTNAFNVIPTPVSSIVFSNMPTIPDIPYKQGYYTTSGTITSTYAIKKVEAHFINASTGAQASKPASQTVSLNGTSIDVPSQVDGILYFGSLPFGYWQLVLTATDSNGASNSWTSNAFYIIDPPCDCSTSVAGWYRVAETGLNINSGHNYESYIGEMPPYALCWVSKGSLSSATYYHVTYQNLEGISSRNYLTKLNSFTLTFNDNGGAGGPGSVTVWDGVSDFSYGEGNYTSVTVPYRNNYIFEGYYTAASGGTQVYNASGSCTNEGAYWSGGAYVRGASATLYAHWRPSLAQSVSVSPKNVTLNIGQSASLTATVLPADVTNSAVNWFIDDPQIATVAAGAKNNNISYATVTAVSPGSTTLRVMTTDGTDLVDVCTVTVLPTLVDGITLTTGATELKAGLTMYIDADVSPANATNTDLVWSSSDPTIAVIESGFFQAYAPGSVTITALAADGSGVSASVTVTVIPVVPDFEISPVYAVMADEGIGSKLAISVSPAEAKDMAIWSSSAPDVAVVDASGVVTAVGAGRAVITAEIPYGPSESCVVQVRNDLSLMTLPLNLETIEEEAFAGVAADRVVIRDACESIGSRAFANCSLLYALIPGTVTATASDAFAGNDTLCIVCGTGTAAEAFAQANGIRYMVDDLAAFVSVRGVSMQGSLTLEIEDSAALNASVSPANASNPTLVYESSDESVAVVAADGTVTGVGPGQAMITAASVDGSGKSAACTVTVTLPNVTVQLSGSESFQTGDDIRALLSAQLSLTGAAADQVQQVGFLLYDAEDHRVGIGMVESAGSGSTLTAECDTFADMNALLAPTAAYRWRCMVVVKGMPFYSGDRSFTAPALPPRIVLSETVLTLQSGASATVYASVLYTDEQEGLWSTSNSSVAMVVDGEIIARSAGTATITVRLAADPTVKATCQVTVTAAAASTDPALTLSASSIQLTRGDTIKLEAAATPPSSFPIQWSSSDAGIAAVDGNGAVTALRAGCAFIFARMENTALEAACEVTVLPRLAESISLNKQSLSLAIGGTDQLTAEVLPLSADERTVIWSCSRPEIVQVEDGTVRGLGTGTATVMAAAADGSGVSAACEVTVYVPPASCGCETRYAGDYVIARTNGTGLAISSGHGASTASGNTELGLIPEGTKVHISRASGPAGQSGCWGHVTYEGIEGYCAMYYVDPVYEVDTSVEHVNAAKLQAVIDRANAWADYVWTAPVDIPVYNNDFDDPENTVAYGQYFWYPAGTEMHGVPYTLASSKYRLETYASLSAANKGMAANFTYEGWLMWGPKYGGDCTCLVNDVLWTGDPTLPHDGQVYMTKKAYLYSNPSWDDLAPGDALANSGHAMIVIAVNGDDVTIVESRGNGSTVGAIHCQNMTPREGGGYYVCGTCAYCNGANKCGAIRRTVKKATLISLGYGIARYKPLYTGD